MTRYGSSRQFAGESQVATVVAMKDRAHEIPSADELIARAKAMIPALKQRAKQCTSERNVPRDSIAEMQAAGFFRILQPKRWGGYEMHPNVFFNVQKILAEGCMSTGWMFGVLG